MSWANFDAALTVGVEVPVLDGLSVELFAGAYKDLYRHVLGNAIDAVGAGSAHERDFRAAMEKVTWDGEKLRSTFSLPFVRCGVYVNFER